MSKAAGRPSIASRTTFSSLDVYSGEESADEEIIEPENDAQQPLNEANVPTDSITDTQTKITKTAQKKAIKAARLEKKLRQQAKAAAKGNEMPVDSITDGESSSSPVALNTTEGLSDTDSSPVTPAVQPSPLSKTNDLPIEQFSPAANNAPNGLHPFLPPSSGLSTPASMSVGSAPSSSNLADSFTSSVQTSKEDSGAVTAERLAIAQEELKKRQNVLTRTLWTFIMIGGFIGLLILGHPYMILLVMLCQTLVYREVTALFSLKTATPDSDDIKPTGKDPWSTTLNWYFFAVTNYFLYGESIIYYFKHVVFADSQLLPFATNHRILSFTLYTIGFVGFVMSLKKGYLKQQFGLFCWVHMSLLLIVVSSHFIVNNILEGLIWFFVPASLVICNDVFAYIWGKTFGRTPLIALSPKKTVEGFVGAFWSTIVFGVLWGTYFMQFDYMICPVHDLGVSAWSPGHCTPNPVFIWKNWEMWKPLAVFLSTALGRTVTTIPYAPYQLHLLVLSCFASLVAPFGGFFASGFKRAFNIKDFGDSIPGHGGMTDRMDCQFLMGVFTYVYYSSLIRQHHVTVGSILQTIVSGLTVNEQLELIADLKWYLNGQGIVIP